MKWGKRTFSVQDMVGDLTMHGWERRRNFAITNLTRRLIKFAALVLVAICLVYVLYPVQREGWTLWLGDKNLAHWSAVVLVGFTAICIPLNRYAWHNGGGDKPLAIGGGVVAALMMIAVLLGSWNFYSATSTKAVGAAEAAQGGVKDTIAETQAALTALEAAAKTEADTYAAKIAAADPRYVTATSRMMSAKKDAAATAATERARLQAMLASARSENVTVQTSQFDPRPVDKFVADFFKADRLKVATTLDLYRSLVFETIALVFVALGTTMALAAAPATAAKEEEAPAPEAAPATEAAPELTALPNLKGQKPPPSYGQKFQDKTWVTGHQRVKRAKRMRQGVDDEAAPLSADDARKAAAFTANEEDEAAEQTAAHEPEAPADDAPTPADDAWLASMVAAGHMTHNEEDGTYSRTFSEADEPLGPHQQQAAQEDELV